MVNSEEKSFELKIKMMYLNDTKFPRKKKKSTYTFKRRALKNKRSVIQEMNSFGGINGNMLAQPAWNSVQQQQNPYAQWNKPMTPMQTNPGIT